jgi:hypothetical protein
MANAQQYFMNQVLTWVMAAQLAVGGLAFLLAHKAARSIRTSFERRMAQSGLSEKSSDTDLHSR